MLCNVQTSMLTQPTATLDMTSPATSDLHISKFKKTTENAASDSFRSNFSGAAFCLPQQLLGILLLDVITFYPLPASMVLTCN